jgi:outer membrane protein assembly factor BamE (lipoprotein component of BamABCDE complex)
MNIRKLFLPIALIFLGVWLLAGCIVIPTFNRTVAGKDVSKQIGSPDSEAPIKFGVSRRDDVRRALGEPLHTSADGRFWVYSWTKLRKVTVWPLCFMADEDAYSSALTLEFEENGVVKHAWPQHSEPITYLWSHGESHPFVPMWVRQYDLWLKYKSNPGMFSSLPPDCRQKVIENFKSSTHPTTAETRGVGE